MFLTNKVSTTHLLAVLFVLVVLPIAWLYLFMVKRSEANPIPVVETELDADVLWSLVQKWRINNNLPEYKKSELACSIAETRLPEIKSNWSHEGFNADRFCKSCTLGENLGNVNNEARMLNSWLHSASHSATLKSEFTHSCIKCSGMYCVHIFSYF